MGDLQTWAPQPNGDDHNDPPAPAPAPPTNPHPLSIRASAWKMARRATEKTVQRIHPTLASETRRRAVVNYVYRLLRGFAGAEVLPFGSVPLKTYLPDGDIDLTAFGAPSPDDSLARGVRLALESEEKNKDAEFEVKDVQYIQAEVRLVKCLVQNIVVDISFNQIGGLSTLCFLEEVDILIGKNNLFKRSIILIKAWCYYESRILGAHHGLISTYALETLVLYIFHLFHSSLDDPLAVLYRFLDYYSKFEWEKYGISLHGPIVLSSLPELVAQPPQNDGGDLLLNKDFLRNCMDKFADLSRGLETNSRNFQLKNLNIVDPLKENNNLGRSVSKGNFYRIRSAFIYGARKLGRILLLPDERIAEEIDMFFMNTLVRHGSGGRSDVEDEISSFTDSMADDHYEVDSVSPKLRIFKSSEDKLISGKTTNDLGEICDKIGNIGISSLDKERGTKTQSDRHSSDRPMAASGLPKHKVESNGPGEVNLVSSRRPVKDARDIATRTQKNPTSSNEMQSSSSGEGYHALPSLNRENGISTRDSIPNQEISMYRRPGSSSETESSTSSTTSYGNHATHVPPGSIDRSVTSGWSTYPLEFPQLSDYCLAGNYGIGSNGSLNGNHLADLTGEHDIHFKNLLFAQSCREYFLAANFVPVQRPFPSQIPNSYSWDTNRRNMYTYMNANGVVHGPPFHPTGYYPIKPSILSGAYGIEDMPKPRGTGTYFPNTNYGAYKERKSPGVGRAQFPTNQMARSRNNGWLETAPDAKYPEKWSQDQPSQAQLPASNGNGHWKPLDTPTSSRASPKGSPHANGFVYPSVSKVEFGTLGPVVLGASCPGGKRPVSATSAQAQGSEPARPAPFSSPASTAHMPSGSQNPERPRRSYQLKNDEDFPPLSS